MRKRVILLHFMRPCVLTCQEFERLDREVHAYAIADPDSMMARICVRIWADNYYTYNEAKEHNHDHNQT